jgi:hypothetical protein
MYIPRIELSNGHKRARKTALAGRGAGPRGEAVHTHGAGEAVKIITGPGIAGPGTTVSFGGNGVIMSARVALLFYGSAWKDVSFNPNAGTILTAVRTILASPYCDVLADYQCNGAMNSAAWNRIINNPPGNPFDGDDCGGVADDLIDNFYSNFPTYNRPNFFAFFLPPGVSLEKGGINGAHSIDGSTRYSWQLYGSLDFITTTFSHELVEAMTDPDGDGWQVDPRDDSNWNEIADVCGNTSARINGVAAAAYFSTSNKACVVPQPNPPPPPPPPPPKLPDGEHQISTGIFESHNGIQFIGIIGGTFDGKPWAMPTQYAIHRVEQGGLRFFTMNDGKRAEVKVGNTLVASFLTTAADNTKLNNLDVIVENNPLRSDYVLWE